MGKVTALYVPVLKVLETPKVIKSPRDVAEAGEALQVRRVAAFRALKLGGVADCRVAVVDEVGDGDVVNLTDHGDDGQKAAEVRDLQVERADGPAVRQ